MPRLASIILPSLIRRQERRQGPAIISFPQKEKKDAVLCEPRSDTHGRRRLCRGARKGAGKAVQERQERRYRHPCDLRLPPAPCVHSHGRVMNHPASAGVFHQIATKRRQIVRRCSWPSAHAALSFSSKWRRGSSSTFGRSSPPVKSAHSA